MPALIPNLVLPSAGAGVETVNDAAVHYSLAVDVDKLQEKSVRVYGEITLGAPGNLLVWVELATEDTAGYYTMLGTASVLVLTGESAIISWTTHSKYARIAVQCPVGADATNYWDVTGWISGKS